MACGSSWPNHRIKKNEYRDTQYSSRSFSPPFIQAIIQSTMSIEQPIAAAHPIAESQKTCADFIAALMPAMKAVLDCRNAPPIHGIDHRILVENEMTSAVRHNPIVKLLEEFRAAFDAAGADYVSPEHDIVGRLAYYHTYVIFQLIQRGDYPEYTEAATMVYDKYTINRQWYLSIWRALDCYCETAKKF